MSVKARQLFSHSLFLFFLVVLVVIGGTILYVSSEHTFYTWDNYAYQGMANGIFESFQKSFNTGLDFFKERMQSENNVIYALPIIPFLTIFGKNRVVYEVALAVLYFIPYLLVLGLVGRLIIPGNKKFVFWLTIGVALLTPVIWLPFIRGYPDIGAALLVALGLLMYLSDIELKQIWRIPALGILLGLAMLVRRHFAYDIIAFFGAAGLALLIVFFSNVRSKKGRAWLNLFFGGLKLSLVVGFILITLVIISPIFVYRGFNLDYNRLYSSYMKPWYEAFRWYGGTYGWLAWIGTGVGLGLLLRAKPMSRITLFITLLGILSVAEWIFFVKQQSIQYCLHFAPVIVLGLTAFLYKVLTLPQGQKRRLLVGLCSGYLVINLAVGLIPPNTSLNLVGSTLFTANWAPVTRQDYNEVVNLVNKLSELTPNKEPIYVIASSYDINPELLSSAERVLYGKNGIKLNLLASPDIDSRDSYPLEPLYKSEFVVVVEPVQYHMTLDQQGVVKAPYDMFIQGKEFAKDFTQLPFKYNLENNSVATIFQRKTNTTLPTALSTLKFMKSYTQMYPASQRDWIILSPSQSVETAETYSKITLIYSELLNSPDFDNPDISLVYADTLPAQINFVTKVKVKENCPDVAMEFMWVDEMGNTTSLTDFIQKAGDNNSHNLSFTKVENSYLMMKISSSRFSQQCPLDIEIPKINPK